MPHRVGHDSKVLFVGRDLLANGRGRWLAFAASIAASAAMFYAQTTDTPRRAETAAVTPTSPTSVPASAPNVASPAEADLLAASAPVAAPELPFQLRARLARRVLRPGQRPPSQGRNFPLRPPRRRRYSRIRDWKWWGNRI